MEVWTLYTTEVHAQRAAENAIGFITEQDALVRRSITSTQKPRRARVTVEFLDEDANPAKSRPPEGGGFDREDGK